MVRKILSWVWCWMRRASTEMNRRALEGSEKAPGKEHPNTLTSLHCLAFLLYPRREYEAALELYLKGMQWI